MNRLITPGHLRIGQIKLAPGQEWSDDAKAWRFVRLSRGAAYWLDTSRPRSVAEGELIIVGPGKKVVIRASQLNEVLLQGFSFAADLLCGFFTLTERHFFEGGGIHGSGEAQFLPSTHPLTERFTVLSGRAATGQDLAFRVEVLGMAMAFFGDVAAGVRMPRASAVSAQHRFHQIISQMPDLEIIHHTPEQLARLCGCSPRHFNRLFHEHFGESPRARQTELRMLKARQLLLSSNSQIIQVALDSGYRSLSLFNALFKRRFGMSPSELRRKMARANGKMLAILAVTLSLVAMSLRGGTEDRETSAGLDFTPNEQTSVEAALPFLLVSATSSDGVESFAPPPPVQPEPETAQKARDALHKKMQELQVEDAAKKHKKGAAPLASSTNAPVSTATSTNGPGFEVKAYELIGNTVLPPTVTDPILLPHTGTNVTFDSIRQALADLQMAYRDRGYVTVVPSLPPQQLTNGIVRIKVTEGRLLEINVLNNRYFSSNNIMRELPSLHTNMLLNALVFQQELDRANANRDRQIYPVLSPGPDPGTTILDLKVKDRLPVHFHADINNYSTPGTPTLRANFSLVDNNLWQLNHQIGLQYSFSPEAYKDGDFPFYDQPLIANYSAYYRMPLGGVNGAAQQGETALSDFGYSEATRRFKAPAATGASELLFYASRSSSDTGVQLQSSTLTPPVLPPEGGLQISDNIYNRTLNPNEDLGTRFTTPIKPLWGVSSTLSMGLDFKNYRSTLTQSRTFQATIFVPDIGTTGPPFTEFPSPAVSTEREVFTSVRYLPFAVNWDANETDATGNTTFSLGQSFNFSSIFNQEQNFQVVAASPKATGNYYVITPGFTREQRISGDYGVRLHADGQWANQPLISNEQISMGGLAGPRGYRDGAQYGDTGWRIQIEPHSPYWNMGLAFDKAPIVTRVYTFVDYGQRFLLDQGERPGTVSMLGTGAGVDVSIGEHFDTRVNFGVPLLDIPGQDAGHLRVEFSIGMQW